MLEKTYSQIINCLFGLLVFAAAGAGQTESPRLVVNAGHLKNITGAAFSPDGNFYATVDESEVKLWETATRRELRSFPVVDDGASVSFSADGILLAAEADKGVLVWETKTGKIVQFFKSNSKPVFGAGGKYLAAVHRGDINLYDAKTFELKATLTAADETSAERIALSADEKTLASIHENAIKIWNPETRAEQAFTLKHQAGGITSLAFSPNGKMLASTGMDGTLRFWDAASGVELQRLKLPVQENNLSNSFFTVCFSLDGKTTISGSLYGVHSWNVAEGVFDRKFETENRADAVVFSPDGKIVLGGMLGGETALWNASDGKKIGGFKPDFDTVKVLGFTPNAKQLVSISSAVAFWNFGNSPDVKMINEPVNNLSLTTDGKMLALGGFSSIRLFDPTAVKLLVSAANEKFKTLSFGSLGESIISPDGKWVAVGGGLFKPGSTILYDAVTGAIVRNFEGFEADTQNLIFSPDGKFLASAGGNILKIATVADGKTISTIKVYDESYSIIYALAFNQKGDLLATGGLGNEIKIWRIADGSPITSIKTENKVNALVFSPDDKTIFAALNGGTIGIWNAGDGANIKQIAAHSADVSTIAFAPDGKIFATGGKDGRIKIWNAESGNLLIELLTIGKTDWVVIASDNRFDSSPAASSFLHWVENSKTVAFETYAAKYRVAGLLQKILAEVK